ncbi:PEP-CTERM sorting domain-containing protein [Sphingomonas piscis]|uniref:PEP-CTERM sorting domain-containing protein n=2 Tax=Sphingomonas piscis TaxID=2714943 RepID=A0A6G7YT29_9SPHN|nr:PEP-CTERM sorting domain-containing protein [Sphingomonas piscis]
MGGVSGSNWIIQSGSNGAGADPAVGGQGDPYLSVLGGGTANFLFAGLSQLGLDYGSADWYNSFVLTLSNGATRTFTGQDVINSPPANGDQGASRTNGRLTFTAEAGTSITGLALSSSSNSLEVDNFGVVAAVPEPSTWAMMLVGFGGVGFSMRRRKVTYRLAQAA